MAIGFRPLPLATAAAPPPPQPNGWHRPFEKAPLRVIIPAALVASGLVWCPQPIAASPNNTVTIDKWQQPLSQVPRLARVVQSGGVVPFNTAQTNTTTIDKWLQPLSKAVPVAQIVKNWTFVPFNTAQVNTQTIDKWQQPLSKAVPAARIVQNWTFVPLNTAQLTTASYGWQPPLSKAPPVARAVHTPVSFVALPFPQVSLGWQQPLSIPLKSSGAVASQPTFVSTPVDVPRGWYQALSQAPLVATVQQGSLFVPFNAVQISTVIINHRRPLYLRGTSYWKGRS